MDIKSVKYGYNWWVERTGKRFLFSGGDPVRSFEAVGSNGQRISVLPEKKIVVVIAGSLRGKRQQLDTRKLMDRYIIPAASSEELPADKKTQARLAELLSRIA